MFICLSNAFNFQGLTLACAIVDATNLIRRKPYGKGGSAHSDVFTPGIASFIWDCISNLEKTELCIKTKECGVPFWVDQNLSNKMKIIN